MEEQEARGIQSQRAGLSQVMMMISIVLFRSNRSSAPCTLNKVRIWEIPGKRLNMKTLTLFLKRPFFWPALHCPILTCAPHLPPLFCQSWSLALSLLSAIARAPLS